MCIQINWECGAKNAKNYHSSFLRNRLKCCLFEFTLVQNSEYMKNNVNSEENAENAKEVLKLPGKT